MYLETLLKNGVFRIIYLQKDLILNSFLMRCGHRYECNSHMKHHQAGDRSSILLSHTKGSCYVHYGVSTGSGSILYQQYLARLFTMRTKLGLLMHWG